MRDPQLLAPLIQWFFPTFFPAHGRKGLGTKAKADAMADGLAHLCKIFWLQTEATDRSGIGEADVGRETNL